MRAQLLNSVICKCSEVLKQPYTHKDLTGANHYSQALHRIGRPINKPCRVNR